ncbi:unnamed protein product, partial [Phaeothamnion confervicola]
GVETTDKAAALADAVGRAAAAPAAPTASVPTVAATAVAAEASPSPAAPTRAAAASAETDSSAMVVHRGTMLAGQGWPGGRRRHRAGAPMWRKRETLIQERIVLYTSVDADGHVQELVETEKSQTEILHMEARETGEFAHRELTEYESTEHFNGEAVVAERGTEEYIHLRSKDDEFEHLESSLPP